MPVGSGSRNGGGRDRDHDVSVQNKANGEEESSNSEDDSTSYDDEESEQRRVDCLDAMQYLEQQFCNLKEMLYQEKVQELNHKIEEVNKGFAPEYVHPQKELEEELQQQIKMAELQLEYRKRNIDNKYQEEVESAHKNFQELCEVTKQRMISDVEERIRRLQEDAVIARLTAVESSSRKRKSRGCEFNLLEKRKKPVTVNGPCVVHMLRDMEIMEDVNDIRRGRAVLEVKSKYRDPHTHPCYQ